MNKKVFKYFVLLIITLLFSACSAATGSRYAKNDTKEKEANSFKELSSEVKEESVDKNFSFDISPYRAKLEINSPTIKNVSTRIDEEEIWYSYEQDENTDNNNLTTTKTRGYRVLVIVTDDLEESNQIKSEIYFITNQKHVYVSFEPPFYKVKVGNYTDISDANNLQFKLNQMGYSESRVVSEEVNIFK